MVGQWVGQQVGYVGVHGPALSSATMRSQLSSRRAKQAGRQAGRGASSSSLTPQESTTAESGARAVETQWLLPRS